MSLVLAIIIRVLEILFVVGIAGSALVVLMTAIEDLRDIISDESGETKQI